jgi:hypothetical protein
MTEAGFLDRSGAIPEALCAGSKRISAGAGGRA